VVVVQGGREWKPLSRSDGGDDRREEAPADETMGNRRLVREGGLVLHKGDRGNFPFVSERWGVVCEVQKNLGVFSSRRV
jgi:hypothetical protein